MKSLTLLFYQLVSQTHGSVHQTKIDNKYQINQSAQKSRENFSCVRYRDGTMILKRVNGVTVCGGDISTKTGHCWNPGITNTDEAFQKCQKIIENGVRETLFCGQDHQNRFGITGYDTAGHWCNYYINHQCDSEICENDNDCINKFCFADVFHQWNNAEIDKQAVFNTGISVRSRLDTSICKRSDRFNINILRNTYQAKRTKSHGQSWQCVKYGEKYAPLRQISGKTQCGGLKTNRCLFTLTKTDCQRELSSIKPVINCGQDHKDRFGDTGYEMPGHWCNCFKNEFCEVDLCKRKQKCIAENCHCVRDQSRPATSIWLSSRPDEETRYRLKNDESTFVSWKRSIIVTDSNDLTYFSIISTSGVKSGCYGGIQQRNHNNDKVAIFSCWNTNDPIYNVWNIHSSDAKGIVKSFDGEGTGQKSMIHFDWSVNEEITFRIDVEHVSDYYKISGYVKKSNQAWIKIASFGRSRKSLHPAVNANSFVEDYNRNRYNAGYQKRRAAKFSQMLLGTDQYNNNYIVIKKQVFSRISGGCDNYAKQLTSASWKQSNSDANDVSMCDENDENWIELSTGGKKDRYRDDSRLNYSGYKNKNCDLSDECYFNYGCPNPYEDNAYGSYNDVAEDYEYLDLYSDARSNDWSRIGSSDYNKKIAYDSFTSSESDLLDDYSQLEIMMSSSALW